MTNRWRPLVLAAALNVVAGSGVAAAQTLVVTGAQPAENVELVLNGTPLGSVAADERGDATIPINIQKNLGKTQIDANILVDACEKTRRVVVVERGGQVPAPEPGCERREVQGLYWVREGTSLVVTVNAVPPFALLVKGSYDPREAYTTRPPRVAPTGFIVTGGAGLLNYRDAVLMGCGNVEDCTGKGMHISLMTGGEFWLNRFMGAEATYLRPGNVKINGRGETYHFDSSLDTHILTVAGKIGVPAGPTRLYGRAGGNYHRAKLRTSDTIDDRTITVNDVEQTLQGGTQVTELKTAGWGWVYGGGLEVWVANSTALYFDLSFMRLRGKETNGGDGRLNDRLTTFFAGVRIHIGG
jgi:hypothetical protein